MVGLALGYIMTAFAHEPELTMHDADGQTHKVFVIDIPHNIIGTGFVFCGEFVYCNDD